MSSARRGVGVLRWIHESHHRLLGEVLNVALLEVGGGLGDQEGCRVLGEHDVGEHAERNEEST